MSERHSTKTCPYCDQPAHRRTGNQFLCKMHLRMRDMRAKAKTNGKTVPTVEQIAAMVRALLANGMRCCGCDCVMNWMRSDGSGTVVSLQHDRSGAFRLICIVCNLRHHFVRDDLFYEVPTGHRWCRGCDKVLPLEAFAKLNNRVKPRCRKCSYEMLKPWKKANRASQSEYERLRRQRHRDVKKEQS